MARINTNIARARNQLNKQKYIINETNGYYIVPLRWFSGFVDRTELGENTWSVSNEGRTSLEKIFSGLESITVEWDQAQDLVTAFPGDVEKRKPLIMKRIVRQWLLDNQTGIVSENKDFKKFQMPDRSKEPDLKDQQDIGAISNGSGRFFMGAITQNQLSGIFGENVIDSSFTNFTVEETYRVYTYQEIKQIDIFQYVYLIPQLDNRQFLYIDSVEKIFIEKDFYCNQITFKTINKKIAKSGGAIDQYIQWTNPGSGSFRPAIVKDNEGIDRIKIDISNMRDYPVFSLQLEFSGPCAFNTMWCNGRPAKWLEGRGEYNPYIETPRMLIPYRLETPIPSVIASKSGAETNYYAGFFQTGFQDYIKDWQKEYARNNDTEAQAQWEGVLETNQAKKVRNTNPINRGDGSHQYNIWNNEFTFPMNDNFDCRANLLSQKAYRLVGNYRVADILAHNYFYSSTIDTLPMSKTSTITWSLRQIPVIGQTGSLINNVLGGLFSFLGNVLGIPSTWQNTKTRLAAPQVPLLMPATIMEYGDNIMPASINRLSGNKAVIPINCFTGQNENEQFVYSGINANPTIFKTSLTDLFSIKLGSERYIMETVYLGQMYPEYSYDNKKIPSNYRDNKVVCLWDETCYPAKPKESGYIVDMVSYKAISNSKCRTTFFTIGNYQVWSGTYKTKANYSSSLRNWTNVLKLSFYELLDKIEILFPQSIVEPPAPVEEFVDIDLTNRLAPIFDYSGDHWTFKPNGRDKWPGRKKTTLDFDFEREIFNKTPELINRTNGIKPPGTNWGLKYLIDKRDREIKINMEEYLKNISQNIQRPNMADILDEGYDYIQIKCVGYMPFVVKMQDIVKASKKNEWFDINFTKFVSPRSYISESDISLIKQRAYQFYIEKFSTNPNIEIPPNYSSGDTSIYSPNKIKLVIERTTTITGYPQATVTHHFSIERYYLFCSFIVRKMKVKIVDNDIIFKQDYRKNEFIGGYDWNTKKATLINSPTDFYTKIDFEADTIVKIDYKYISNNFHYQDHSQPYINITQSAYQSLNEIDWDNSTLDPEIDIRNLMGTSQQEKYTNLQVENIRLITKTPKSIVNAPIIENNGKDKIQD